MTHKKIKLLILANDLFVGGVQKLIVDMANGMDREVFDVVIVTLFSSTARGNFFDSISSDIPIHKLSFRGFLDIGSWRVLISILRKEKPDIIKTALFFSNTVGRVLKPFFSYEVVAAEHNTEVNRSFGLRIVNWLLAPFCRTIVGDSQMVADFVSKIDRINRKKFTVIYNGVELSDIAKAKEQYMPDRVSIRNKLGITRDDRVFLNVARLSEQKNHLLMIDGFNELRKKQDRVKLIIIGDGPNKQKLEARIKTYGIETDVYLLGERTDIYRYYVASDYFLLTSLREGFCISAMNGLAFGLPLISTRVAGVIEYLKDGVNGYFIEQNKESVGTVLLKAIQLSTEEYKNMSKYAQESAEEFTVTKYIQRYNDLFKSLV